MVELVQKALDDHGIDDTIVVAGQFAPRGRSGSTFAGALIGGDVGDALGGSVGEAIGVGAGMLGGAAAGTAASGLPAKVLVGVSATMVYGLHSATRHTEPDALVFRCPRADITAHVHQRVNVRVLELVDEASGSRIELEGNRLPLTHSKDVMDVLTAATDPASE